MTGVQTCALPISISISCPEWPLNPRSWQTLSPNGQILNLFRIPEPVQDPQYNSHDRWTMYFDGSLMLSGSRAGVVLESPTGETLKYAIQLNFQTTNNMAEYEGLLAGIRAAKALAIR